MRSIVAPPNGRPAAPAHRLARADLGDGRPERAWCGSSSRRGSSAGSPSTTRPGRRYSAESPVTPSADVGRQWPPFRGRVRVGFSRSFTSSSSRPICCRAEVCPGRTGTRRQARTRPQVRGRLGEPPSGQPADVDAVRGTRAVRRRCCRRHTPAASPRRARYRAAPSVSPNSGLRPARAPARALSLQDETCARSSAPWALAWKGRPESSSRLRLRRGPRRAQDRRLRGPLPHDRADQAASSRARHAAGRCARGPRRRGRVRWSPAQSPPELPPADASGWPGARGRRVTGSSVPERNLS